jgi:hypothetical protein
METTKDESQNPFMPQPDALRQAPSGGLRLA